MSLATGGDFEELGAETTIRRPISVAQLMEREGFRPTARSRATKRALSGVAAGAVLALGAVVGSLFLNHSTTTTADAIESGHSGGDIVLAESGQQPAQAKAPVQSLSTTTPSAPQDQQRSAPAQHSRIVKGRNLGFDNSGTISGSVAAPSNSAASGSPAPTTQSAASSTQQAPATQSAPSTQSAPATSASSDPSSAPSNGAGQPATSSSSSASASNNGGLLGTVTGTLGDVTGSVFSWFGS